MTKSDLPKSAKAYRNALPKLTDDNYDETSDYDPSYNCIGHAAGTKKWWQPLSPKGAKHYWPPSATKAETLQAYAEAYQAIGYSACADGALEDGVEKIAIYAISGVPKHAARQLTNGRWTSKLGKSEDIEHDLNDVSCVTYGSVSMFMSRARK